MAARYDFVGLHVVVTGGTGALGSAVVGELVEAGATCHVPNNNPAELNGFPHGKNPRVHITQGVDLVNESAVDRYFAGLPPLWASIHIAGGFAMASLVETKQADFAAMMNINATSCFLSCRAAVQAIRRGERGGGRIVNIAARPAIDPRRGAGMVAYTASKAAVAAITTSLAEELVGEGILVNAVAPSVLDTPGNRAGMPNADYAAWVSLPSAASSILFLASRDNASTSGAIVPLYGRS